MKNYNTECKLCELDIPHSHVTDEDFYPKVKPLSDDEICKALGITGNEEPRYIKEAIADARAIEKAHGIGEDKWNNINGIKEIRNE